MNYWTLLLTKTKFLWACIIFILVVEPMCCHEGLNKLLVWLDLQQLNIRHRWSGSDNHCQSITQTLSGYLAQQVIQVKKKLFIIGRQSVYLKLKGFSRLFKPLYSKLQPCEHPLFLLSLFSFLILGIFYDLLEMHRILYATLIWPALHPSLLPVR